MKWQPIETAPETKTGMFFCLLAWGHPEDQSIGTGFRCDGKWYAAGFFYQLGQGKRFGIREIEVQPTHWMEAPSAPACEYCDGSGDVHTITGEWRGLCSCPAGKNPEPL